MTTSSLTPHPFKGALVTLEAQGPGASVIVFQYNPDTMTRRLQAQTLGSGEGDRSEAMRLKGAPVENISIEVEIDATEQPGKDEGLGIYPQLSALETLIYPRSSVVRANAALLALGTIEIIPAAAPLTLFVWGPKRVLPVRLSDFTITEEAYDRALNPVRAKVSLGLRVLSYNDLPVGHPGYNAFLAHQDCKERLASSGVRSGTPTVYGELGLRSLPWTLNHV